MTDRVWQTTVYDKSHRRIGFYHFRNRIDVEKSVKSSWSNNRAAIKQLNMADSSLVWAYTENNAIAVEAIQIEITISETWTHF